MELFLKYGIRKRADEANNSDEIESPIERTCRLENVSNRQRRANPCKICGKAGYAARQSDELLGATSETAAHDDAAMPCAKKATVKIAIIAASDVT